MSMTMTQKILASRAGLGEVVPGRLIESSLDLVLGNDITAPLAIREFERMGMEEVFDRRRVALVLDHFTPNKDIRAAELCRTVREFARRLGIVHFFEGGDGGIEHVLLPERGLVAPGDVVIGADSHTCTYGALGAFSTGVGSTDMAAGMATGRAWFKVPAAIRFNLTGRCPEFVGGKDVILSIIGRLGVDGAAYRSMEFGGPGLGSLSMDDRFTIANMAVEAGAKNGIFETDGLTDDYVRSTGGGRPRRIRPDAGAVYEKTVDVHLPDLSPLVALPSSPGRVRPAAEVAGTAVDQVVIGSCTNGRMQDLRAAAGLLKGRKVSPRVRLLVIPGSQRVYLQAIEEGLIETFVRAGAVIGPPTCGPCLGGHMGVLARGETALATTNRNFVGRMGHPESLVYLAGPAVAAATAVTGCVSHPAALAGFRSEGEPTA